MGRYLINYIVPALPRKRVVSADTPEEAARSLRRILDPLQVTDLSVVDLEDENAEPKEVLGICMHCDLPVWLTDDLESYRTITENFFDTFAHTACLKEAK